MNVRDPRNHGGTSTWTFIRGVVTTGEWGIAARQRWEDVTTHRAWRHTVGRISCLARIPIYALGIAAQGLKVGIKVIVSPVTSLVAWATGTKKLDSWTFKGIAKDAIVTGHLVDRTINSAICVIFAPPKNYRSLSLALKQAKQVIVEGKHHKPDVKKLFDHVIEYRAQYWRQIIQSSSGIYGSALREGSEACKRFLRDELDFERSRVKAG